MQPIDIDALSEDELIELNHKVVARLRFLSQTRSHSAMLDFRVGERVNGGPELLGTLTRYNKKTVTVVTGAGQNWNVSPGLLIRANPPDTATASSNDSAVARFPDRSAEKLEAPNKAETYQPDLLLLAIQMPGADGFEVLSTIPSDDMPLVVFTRAYDQYAIRDSSV